MEASKDTIDNLMHSVAIANQELYSTITEDSSILDNCEETTPALLRDVAELRMDVKFILVDLQAIMRSCFETNKAYEKRYYLKNLYAGMLEGYKLLYGFGNLRKRTVWTRIGDDLQAAIQQNQMKFESLKDSYDEITKRLLAIEATRTDQDDRNPTYHYDDDLLLVYRLTLKTESEEKATEKYIGFIKILGSMLELGKQIEINEAMIGNILPEGFSRHDDIALMIIQKVAESMGKHPQLETILSTAVEIGAKQLDSYAKYKRGVIGIEDYIDKNIQVKMEIPELGIMKQMLDVQMLVSFMMADMATILRRFIGAGIKVEYPLLLRRLTISRVSTLNHLISYHKDVSDSMWSRIINVIPADNEELHDEADKILLVLKCLRKPGDCDKRALYVHLIDNHKYHSNVPGIVNSLERVTILSELQSSQEVVKVCGRISSFIGRLMTALSEQARKSRIASSRKLKTQIDGIRNLTYSPNCPDVFRDSLRQQMDDLEKLLEF